MLFNLLQSFLSSTNTSSSSLSTGAAAAAASPASSAASSATTAAVNITSIPPTSPAELQLVHDVLSSDLAVREFVPWLDYRSRACLDRISHHQHNLFFSFSDVLLLPKLAHYIVVKPNPDKVIAILRAHPELLQSKIKEVVVNGISIRGYTPVQLAYSACDVAATEGELGLCEVLRNAWVDFLGNEEAALAEVQRQIVEKKLNVVDSAKDGSIKNVLATALNDVIQAISNEQFNLGRDDKKKWILNPATHAAIATFRAALIELQPKVVVEGMHFRSNTIQETFDAYAQAAATWGHDYQKYALFEDGVLSSVFLSCMPVNDKQRLFGQGFYYLYEQCPKEPFARHMTVRNTNINFDDYLRADSVEFSGLSGSCYNMFDVGTAHTRFARHYIIRAMGGNPGPDVRVSKLMSNKNSALQNLCNRAEHRLQPGQ